MPLVALVSQVTNHSLVLSTSYRIVTVLFSLPCQHGKHTLRSLILPSGLGFCFPDTSDVPFLLECWHCICVPSTSTCFPLFSRTCSLMWLDKPGHINLLKPTGHVMHQQFNIQQLYVLPTLNLCVLYLSENKQRLVPLTA